MLSSMAARGLFASSIFSAQPCASWSRIEDRLDMDGDSLPSPSARGGHAMCYDRTQGRIYLFGGWDGKKSLNDFWVFDIQESSWKLIPQRSTSGGDAIPSARACHKMVFDEATGDIFLLGRLDETTPTEPSSEPPATTVDPVPIANVAVPRVVPQLMVPPSMQMRGANPRISDLVRVPPSPPVEASRSRTPVVTSTSTRDFASEFYRYHTRGPDAGKWELISPDTAVRAIFLSNSVVRRTHFLRLISCSSKVVLRLSLTTRWL